MHNGEENEYLTNPPHTAPVSPVIETLVEWNPNLQETIQLLNEFKKCKESKETFQSLECLAQPKDEATKEKGPIQQALESEIKKLETSTANLKKTLGFSRLIDDQYLSETEYLEGTKYALGHIFDVKSEELKKISHYHYQPLPMFRAIGQECDKKFLEIENTQQIILNATSTLVPLIAEAKVSNINEIKEQLQIEEYISNALTKSENKMQTYVDQKLFPILEQQKTLLNIVEHNKSELVSTVGQQIEEVISLANAKQTQIQEELIKNLRNSFERKMNAKDSVIKDLHDKIALHDRLHNVQEREINSLQNEIKSLRTAIDQILRRRTEDVLNDINIRTSPQHIRHNFPDIK